MTYRASLRTPHPEQSRFITSTSKRKIIRAGRRSGKTVGIAIPAVQRFMEGRRVLYAAPTQEQIDAFWFEIKLALKDGLDKGLLHKNESLHSIEVPGTKNRLRAKTAWNADTLRGDYTDYLILDEFHLMAEDAWRVVGAPMLLDNDGDAVFIYTPPSRRTTSMSKAKDKLHAAKMYKWAEGQERVAREKGLDPRWQVFTFTSHANPYLSKTALSEITSDMTPLDYKQEILAVDVEDAPGALWTRSEIDALRVFDIPLLTRIAVAIDPSATAHDTSDEAGIVACGIGPCNCTGKLETHGFVLEDSSLRGTPSEWAGAAVALYNKLNANVLVAEANHGHLMVSLTISTIEGAPSVKLVNASHGKVARAEPVYALYTPVDDRGAILPGRVHHVGYLPGLEDEMCNWIVGMPSPNRLDALVWALTELMVGQQSGWTKWAQAQVDAAASADGDGNGHHVDEFIEALAVY